MPLAHQILAKKEKEDRNEKILEGLRQLTPTDLFRHIPQILIETKSDNNH